MSKFKKQERDRLKRSESRARRNRRLRNRGIAFSFVFVLSVSPYAYSLFVHPSIGNTFLLVGLTIAGLFGIGFIVRSEMRKQAIFHVEAGTIAIHCRRERGAQQVANATI